MHYLVDANVLGETTKPRPVPAVIEWLRDNDAEIVVNPIILGELRFGISQLPSGKRRTRLEQWYAGGLKRIPTVEIDADTADVWARLLAELKRIGRTMPVKDSLIAATARQYGFTVVTCNTRDFRATGINAINPFDT